jgi:GNAT superfamily N-acetyltransferase
VAGEVVVGWSEARLEWTTSAHDVASLWIFVGPNHRRRSLGAELCEAARAHLASLGARALESWASDEDGNRFLVARRFERVRAQRVLSLELGTADPSDYATHLAAKEAEGFSVVLLAAVAHRTEELHALDAAATADVPQVHTEDDVRFEDWVDEMLAAPQLTREGSFVVLAGELPVAYAFIEVDPAAGLAANEMTGTSPEHRRRGLARLAKLATITWAREQGLTAILTGSDSTNVGMLGLNDSLGYRSVATERVYLKD